MPPPFAYQNPTLEFERFLVAARDHAGLATTNMAWNMVVGVLHTLRRRLNVVQTVALAQVMPPVVRALFIEGWDPEAPPLPFGEAPVWLAEVRSVRPDHNFSPDNAVAAVTRALRGCVEADALAAVLPRLPPGARGFLLAGEEG